MKQSKITHYKIPFTPEFLSGHPRVGEPTYFKEKIQLGLGLLIQAPGDFVIDIEPKIHTIRQNFILWKKRVDKVRAGKAVIDLCEWKLPGGRFTPGNKLITFATLDKDSGCGVQILRFPAISICERKETPLSVLIDNPKSIYNIGLVGANDGLSLEDFKEWFKGYDISKHMAIIHFTSFRY